MLQGTISKMSSPTWWSKLPFPMGTWSLKPFLGDSMTQQLPPNVIGLVNHSRNLRTVEGAIWPRNWYVNLILKSKSCFAWVNDGELTRQVTKKGDAPSLNSNCTVKRCAERHATLSAEDPSAPIWSCTGLKGTEDAGLSNQNGWNWYSN